MLQPLHNLDETEIGPEEFQTSLRISGFHDVSEQNGDMHGIFDQSSETIEFWLRSYTAVGQIGGYLGREDRDIEMKVLLKIISPNDGVEEE